MAIDKTSQQMMLASASFSDSEMLSFIVQNGRINLSDVAEDMKKARRELFLKGHPYAISQGTDGRWRTYFKDDSKPSGRIMIAKSTLEKLQDAIVMHYEDEEDNTKTEKITLEELYNDWLEYKKLHTDSASYIYRIGTEWDKHYKSKDIVKWPIKSLTKLQLDEWAHTMIRDHNMSRKQYYNATMIMRQVLEYAVDREILESNPFSRVKPDSKLFRRVPKKPSETQVFSVAEEAAFEEEAWKDFRERKHPKRQLVPLATLFMFYTGVRISEACALRYDDIEGNEIHVQRMVLDYDGTVAERTKSNAGDRYVYIPAKGRAIIDAARARQQEEGVSDSGYIFSMNEKPCPYDAIRKCFAKYCKRIGTINKSSHKARKTYISTLIDAGVNINTIREMVGHEDERTTFNSYCFDRTDKTDRMKLIEKALA